ncbi:MAG: hypothetical protein J6Y85_03840 [Alphaproteobacteria bacterium]|nr:hypothetical protein [Alphaproteobacteria bacterium]
MKIIVNENLPKLSWLLTIKKDENTLLCGSSVETKDNMIFEGSVCFSNKEKNYLSLSNLYFGSGVLEHEDKTITVFTPSHVFDYVWIIKNTAQNEIYVSNSIFFCAAKTNLSVNQLLWSSHFTDLFKGIGNFDRLLSKIGEYEIYGCSICQVYIKNFQINFADMIYQNHFKNFEDYHSYLKKVVKQCYDNFNADKAIVYLSKGYDSVCCATLVSEIQGIARKIALSKPLDKHGLDDSGEEIAKTLNLELVFLPDIERDFELIPDTPTSQQKYKAVYLTEKDNLRISDFSTFWVYPHDESLYCDDVDYNKSIVLFGGHGDTIWSYKNEICDNFKRSDYLGSSMAEYRLKRGFCYLPLAAIASVKHSNLVEICNSEEMKPYIVGGNYDRPIPRRIAEDFGKLKRGTFATKKLAIATPIKSFPQRNELLQMKIDEYKTIITS